MGVAGKCVGHSSRTGTVRPDRSMQPAGPDDRTSQLFVKRVGACYCAVAGQAAFRHSMTRPSQRVVRRARRLGRVAKSGSAGRGCRCQKLIRAVFAGGFGAPNVSDKSAAAPPRRRPLRTVEDRVEQHLSQRDPLRERQPSGGSRSRAVEALSSKTSGEPAPSLDSLNATDVSGTRRHCPDLDRG